LEKLIQYEAVRQIQGEEKKWKRKQACKRAKKAA
jgi:hypothetical protein